MDLFQSLFVGVHVIEIAPQVVDGQSTFVTVLPDKVVRLTSGKLELAFIDGFDCLKVYLLSIGHCFFDRINHADEVLFCI
jgi:hypothetical protein